MKIGIEEIMVRITEEEFKHLSNGTAIKIVWLCSSDKEYAGVINGDKINWDDGSHNEIWEIATAVQKGRCIVYSMGYSKINKTATFSRCDNYQ